MLYCFYLRICVWH